jgi:hypothetical protein
MNTRSLTYPQRKKSQSIMSGDLGGHSISCWSFPDAHPIQRPGNTVFRYWQTSQWKWAGLLSCWNMNIGIFCNCGISHSCNMSRYVMPRVRYEMPCINANPLHFQCCVHNLLAKHVYTVSFLALISRPITLLTTNNAPVFQFILLIFHN